MNQGKLEVVKDEMARVNIDILGLSELKWTAMGECNSDDQYMYHCRQESHRRNGVAIIVNKRVQNVISLDWIGLDWMQSQKRENDLCSFSKQTIQYYVIQVYALSSNAEEAEVE